MNRTLSPRDKSKPDQWRLNWACVSAWRIWDGEAVIYDDLSGDTLKLDVVMTEIFVRLQKDGASSEALAQHIARFLDLEADLRIERLVETAIQRFANCGLIEPVDAWPQTGGTP